MPALSMTVVQFCGWDLQSAVRAVREYVYVNSPFTSSRTNSAFVTSWNFPSRHLGHSAGLVCRVSPDSPGDGGGGK